MFLRCKHSKKEKAETKDHIDNTCPRYMNWRMLVSLAWSTFPRYKSGFWCGFFRRMFLKKGLEAAKIPLCASICWSSAETRVTSVKSLCSQSFERVSGALPCSSVDWTEIILPQCGKIKLCWKPINQIVWVAAAWIPTTANCQFTKLHYICRSNWIQL